MQCITQTAIGRDIMGQLNGWLQNGGYSTALMVTDTNTAAIGRALQFCPTVQVHTLCYEDTALIPDETAVERLFSACSKDKYDVLIAVGSGVINDLTRYAACQLRLPYYVAATAASMDGYASTVAPLIVSGMKVTYPAVAPMGILADINILETAPPLMTAAGFGDIMGKYTCLNDWELGYLLDKEPYNEKLVNDVRDAITLCLPGKKEKSSIENIMKALIISGLVMQQVGNSRPASGGEHHLAHFWEMMFLMQNKTPVLHGIKVGAATLAAIRVNEWLANEPVDWDYAYKCASCFNYKAWQDEIRRVYRRAADGVLALWPEEPLQTQLNRIDRYREQWPNIQAVIKKNIPPCAEIETYLRQMGCAVSPAEIGVSRDDFINSIIHANRLRTRFTVFRLADELGLLSNYAQRFYFFTT